MLQHLVALVLQRAPLGKRRLHRFQTAFRRFARLRQQIGRQFVQLAAALLLAEIQTLLQPLMVFVAFCNFKHQRHMVFKLLLGNIRRLRRAFVLQR